MLDPIRTITSDRGGSTRRTGLVLLSLLATVAVLLVVLPLLASDDAVFGSVLGDALFHRNRDPADEGRKLHRDVEEGRQGQGRPEGHQ